MTAARKSWVLGLGLAALAGGCGGPTNADFARAKYDAMIGRSMTDVMRAGIVPTGFTATNATTRLYTAQGSNVVQTLSGPMVAYVACNLTIEVTDPTGASGSDAFIVRRIDFSGACG